MLETESRQARQLGLQLYRGRRDGLEWEETVAKCEGGNEGRRGKEI